MSDLSSWCSEQGTLDSSQCSSEPVLLLDASAKDVSTVRKRQRDCSQDLDSPVPDSQGDFPKTEPCPKQRRMPRRLTLLPGISYIDPGIYPKIKAPGPGAQFKLRVGGFPTVWDPAVGRWYKLSPAQRMTLYNLHMQYDLSVHPYDKVMKTDNGRSQYYSMWIYGLFMLERMYCLMHFKWMIDNIQAKLLRSQLYNWRSIKEKSFDYSCRPDVRLVDIPGMKQWTESEIAAEHATILQVEERIQNACDQLQGLFNSIYANGYHYTRVDWDFVDQKLID